MIADGDGGGKAPTGAFAATLDADSKGEEGKFYVWSEAEIDELLGEDSALFKAHYDVRPQGNWEGKTILNRTSATRPGAQPTDSATEARLATCRERLLAARAPRVPPGWDAKGLADWHRPRIPALAQPGTA